MHILFSSLVYTNIFAKCAGSLCEYKNTRTQEQSTFEEELTCNAMNCSIYKMILTLTCVLVWGKYIKRKTVKNVLHTLFYRKQSELNHSISISSVPSPPPLSLSITAVSLLFHRFSMLFYGWIVCVCVYYTQIQYTWLRGGAVPLLSFKENRNRLQHRI